MRHSIRFLPLLALPFTAGCASTTAPSKPAVIFPSATELAQLPSEPPRVEAFGTNDIGADSWALGEPLAVAPAEDPSPAGDFLRDVERAHGPAVRSSASLQCAAREVARFLAQHHALPNDPLRRFMAARCGGDAPGIAPIAWSVEAPASVTDVQVMAKGRPEIERMLAQHLQGGGDHELGIALVREGGTAALVAIAAEKSATLQPGPYVVDARGKLTLRGVVRKGVASILALANQGAFGVAECATNPTVALPKFEIACDLAHGDPWAWVEVVGQRTGQVLEEPIADLIMYEGDGSAVTYAPRNLGAPAPVSSPASFTSGVLDHLNALRQKAKLRPLTLAPKQSEENARLAGTIFDASLQGDSATLNRATIGLLAGWKVDGGTIRSGHFYLGAVAPTRDAAAWLGAAVERPIGRAALLDRDVRQIAIGPAIPDAPALGAAITTYALFDAGGSHAAEEKQFLHALAAARQARGLPAPERVGGFDEATAMSAQVLEGKKAPMDALNEMMQAAAGRTGSTVHGYLFETIDPTRAEFPADFLREGPLDVIVVVTHHRAVDAAWGQYVIFALVVDATKTVTASATPSGVHRAPLVTPPDTPRRTTVAGSAHAASRDLRNRG